MRKTTFFMGSLFAGGVLFFGEGLSRPPSDRAENSDLPSRSVELRYHFTVQAVPGNAKRVTVWVPLPPTNQHQTLENFRVRARIRKPFYSPGPPSGKNNET